MSDDKKGKNGEKDYTGTSIKVDKKRELDHVDNISKAEKKDKSK